MYCAGYVEFVVQSIRNKELFHGIDIRYKHCWSYLLWLDEANHAGIQVTITCNTISLILQFLVINGNTEAERQNNNTHVAVFRFKWRDCWSGGT